MWAQRVKALLKGDFVTWPPARNQPPALRRSSLGLPTRCLPLSHLNWAVTTPLSEKRELANHIADGISSRLLYTQVHRTLCSCCGNQVAQPSKHTRTTLLLQWYGMPSIGKRGDGVYSEVRKVKMESTAKRLCSKHIHHHIETKCATLAEKEALGM